MSTALSAEQAGALTANYGIMDQPSPRFSGCTGISQPSAAIRATSPSSVSLPASFSVVHTLMTTSLTQGLFHKAIVESGGGRPGTLGGRPVSGAADSGEARGLAFAKKFGVAGQDAAADIIWLIAASIRLTVTKVSEPHNSRVWITRIRCERSVGRLMDDTKRRQSKLISLY